MKYGKWLLFMAFSVLIVTSTSAQKGKKGKVENDPWAAYEAEKNKMVDDDADKKEEASPAKKTAKSTEKAAPAKSAPKPKFDKNAPKSNTGFNQNKGTITEAAPKDSATIAREKVEQYLQMKAQQNVKRPTVKPQDIKDPVDRTMKGPSGQTVYKSPKGGRYYIDNIGVKTYLTPDK